MSVRRLSNSTISTQGRGKSSTFLAGYSPGIDEMDLIQRAVVGVDGVSAIEFTSIPQTYQHLHLRVMIRTNRTNTGEALTIRFNDDTANNYTFFILYGEGTGSAAGAAYTSSQNKIEFQSMAASSAAAGIFGIAVGDILDYTNTTKNKVVRGISGIEYNGSGVITLNSGLWMSTAAINKITLDQPISTAFVQYTTAALYGVVG